MKVRIVNGRPFVSTKVLAKLTPHDPTKDPVLITVSSIEELSKKVKEIGAIEVEAVRTTCLFKEGMY